MIFSYPLFGIESVSAREVRGKRFRREHPYLFTVCNALTIALLITGIALLALMFLVKGASSWSDALLTVLFLVVFPTVFVASLGYGLRDLHDASDSGNLSTGPEDWGLPP